MRNRNLLDVNMGFFMVKSILIFCCFVSLASHHVTPVLEQSGDINLVGLIDIKGTLPNKSKCAVTRPSDGIIPALALKYAVDRVNNDSKLLADLKLGYKIYDSCDSSGLQKLLVDILFIPNTVGIIGPNRNSDVTMTAVVMSLWHRLIIAFSMAPLHFEQNPSFRNLFRATPPMDQMIQAMVDFIFYMKWNYIGAFYQNSEYGIAAVSDMKKFARKRNICLSDISRIESTDVESYSRMLLNKYLLNNKKIEIIVLFLEEETLIKFMHGVSLIPRDLWSHVTFISGSKWGTKQIITKGIEDVVKGVITFQPTQKNMRNFKSYFYNLDVKKSKLLFDFKKELRDEIVNITQNLTTEQFYSKFGDVSHSSAGTIINSVNAYAYAVDRYWRFYKKNLTKLVLKRYLLIPAMERLYKVRRVYPFNRSIYSFRSDHRINSNFDIFNYQKMSNNRFAYKLIGRWELISPEKVGRGNYAIRNSSELITNYSRLTVNHSAIQWRDKIPKSICSKACKSHQIKVISKRYSSCCWECKNCGDNNIVVNNSCAYCGRDYKATNNFSACEVLPIKMVTTNVVLVYSFYCIGSVGVLLSILATFLFIKFRDKLIIRASSRELCMFICLGITLLYSFPVLAISTASKVCCIAQKCFFFIGFNLIYGSLMLKTNRIYRIFAAARSSTIAPKVVSPISQVIFASTLCLVQIILLSPSINSLHTQKQYPSHRHHVEIYCKVDTSIFFINFTYILSIMASTTFYAFRTRTFPKNYNESKDIGITMYITCFIFGIGLVSYFLLTNSQSRIIAISFVSILCATVVLFGLFTTKFLIIYKSHVSKKDENKNVDKQTWEHATNRLQSLSTSDIRIYSDKISSATTFTVEYS
ncbi:metabotropic glutamate receptor 3-like [Hydractinia symbiolongicarpus]|uniref:metabotropic glutamate receptor 3-like n=1 Tax=Hydractinia symbiolongicarpus TaxID=13093 RepID=UPI00254EBD4A|nr:metabotropic glutamate receptor 3-like [Hydractinia symbiolongicarpus]